MMKTRLLEILGHHRKRRLTAPERISSAVLVPLFEDETGWNIVFIKRTWRVSTHKGQLAFPGGARDEVDADLRATALRESWEEIGLKPEDTEVIGELDDEFTTTSHYIMTPFVAVTPWPYQFKANRFEVEKILTVPMAVLLEEQNVVKDTEMLDGEPLLSFSYHHQGEVIWGATARILQKFLEMVETSLHD